MSLEEIFKIMEPPKKLLQFYSEMKFYEKAFLHSVTNITIFEDFEIRSA